MRATPFNAVVLGWLVPGAGHFLTGATRKAVIFFVVLTGMFAIGLGFLPVSLSVGVMSFVFSEPVARDSLAEARRSVQALRPQAARPRSAIT